MKKHITIAGIIFLASVFILPMMAFGQGGRMEKNQGKMMRPTVEQTPALTAEQKSQIEDLLKKFREDNADTLKQLMTKRFDLNTILDTDNPDAGKAKAIQKDISDLEAKLAQKRIDLYVEMHKINPNAKYNSGMGRNFGMKGR